MPSPDWMPGQLLYSCTSRKPSLLLLIITNNDCKISNFIELVSAISFVVCICFFIDYSSKLKIKNLIIIVSFQFHS